MTEAIVTAAVLAAMAALGAHDARRAMVDPRLVLVLLAAAAAWRFGPGGGGEGTWARLAEGVLGAAFGVAAVMVPIAAASWFRRRWPLYPGDAMLLGALGFLLGPLGLAWTMALGAAFALIYRFCVQRRRGRPFRRGLVPLGPGMCAGAAVVFLCVDFGVALADEQAPSAPIAATELAIEPLDGVDTPMVAGARTRLPATELAPQRPSLPAVLAAQEVILEGRDALPFPALIRRLAALSDIAMRIEERPSRIAGGGAALADPPPLRLAWKGTLAGLLDRVAARTGYDWSWETLVPETLGAKTLAPETPVPETLGPEHGAVVFHRYWDIEQRGPAPADSSRGGAGTQAEEGTWSVDPAAHGTLRGVLEDWAARAGWTLVWETERDWRLGAPAAYEGGFLEAADLLLSGPATSRALDARAYAANRHLVVDDVDGADW